MLYLKVRVKDQYSHEEIFLATKIALPHNFILIFSYHTIFFLLILI